MRLWPPSDATAWPEPDKSHLREREVAHMPAAAAPQPPKQAYSDWALSCHRALELRQRRVTLDHAAYTLRALIL
jgi:hypothetical protein